MAFVNPATTVTVGAVDSHHLLGLYPSHSCRYLFECLGCRYSTVNFVAFRSGQMLSLSISPTSHTNLRSSCLRRSPDRC